MMWCWPRTPVRTSRTRGPSSWRSSGSALPPEQVIHVAFGFEYDIGTAQNLGMQSAWVNRHVEPRPGPAKPDHEWRDLRGLARLMGGPGPGID